MEQDTRDLDRALNWLSKAASTALSVALIWPKTTALAALATVALAVTLFIASSGAPKQPRETTNAWRLDQMLQAVQRADARIHAEKGDRIELDSSYRGVWDTLKDKDQPGDLVVESTEPASDSSSPDQARPFSESFP